MIDAKFTRMINSKLPSVDATIFTKMTKLANEQQAINLAQGFPDFHCSEKLIDLVSQMMRKGNNQYAPMPGVIELREQMAILIEKWYGRTYNPDTEITITAGATQAIYTAISAVVREGDEVLVFEPAYDCYEPAILMNGGKPVYIKLKQPDFSIPWNQVKKLVNHRTRMIILNNPHNPSGYTFQESDLKELEKITRDTDIVILSDEVYEHIFFSGEKHWSVTSSKILSERSFYITSFGKTVHTTGWKIGCIAGPAPLMKEFRKVHQFLVFSCNHPIQLALAEFMKDEDYVLEVRQMYKIKRDFFLQHIKGSRFTFTPASGTYFQLLGYSGISNEKDIDFAIRLTQEKKIASIPLSSFYHEHDDMKILRFCFAKKDETIEKAAEILRKL